MKESIRIKRLNATLAADVTQDGGNYILYFDGMPNITGKDGLSLQGEKGKTIDLKIIRMEQVTSRNGYGPAMKVTTAPILFKQCEVTVKADVARDGDTFILKLDDVFSFKDGKGKIIELKADRMEFEAKQIKKGNE